MKRIVNLTSDPIYCTLVNGSWEIGHYIRYIKDWEVVCDTPILYLTSVNALEPELQNIDH